MSNPTGTRLDGKVALVTGAANGIGRAIATRLASDGARVVLADIDLDALQSPVAEIGDDRAFAVRCDVTNERDVETLVAAAVERFGGLDIAVANAGKGTFSPVIDHPLETWQEIMDLCLTGVMLTYKHAGKVMRDGGSMMVISSLNSMQPAAGMGAYCAAKAGVVMLTKCAAIELGPRGIRVNAIAPGLVETAATGAFWAVPGVVEEFVENTTVGRFAQPADIANVAAFLASDETTFVSGSVYSIDGGASTKRYPDIEGALGRLAGASEPA